MSNKSNFLKNLLTTASAFAVITGASTSAMGTRFTDNNAGDLGVADAEAVVNGVSVATGKVANWSQNDSLFLTNSKDINLGIAGKSGARVGAIDINNHGGRTINVVLSSSVGSIIDSTGKQVVTLNVANGQTLTLNNQAGLKADGTAQTGGVFTAVGETKLDDASILLVNVDKAQLTGAINAVNAGNGTLQINAAGVILSGAIGQTNKLGALKIDAAKSATIEHNASIGAITIGDGATLSAFGTGKTLTATTIDGAAANNGTLSFSGKHTAAVDKLGHGKELNLVEVIGSGSSVDFSKTTDYKATKTNVKDDATITFSNALGLETNFTTGTNNTGKIVFSDVATLTGSIGSGGTAFKEVHLGADKTLTFNQDGAKLYATNVTTKTANEGTIEINSNKFEIHADIGTANAIKSVIIKTDAAGTGTATVKLMEGKKINANAGVIFDSGVHNSVLELYKDTRIVGVVNTNVNQKGIISVKGNSTITGGVTGAGGNTIDKISFDSASSLTLETNTVETANGVNFAQDGSLVLTKDADFTLAQGVTTKAADANGIGSIIINEAKNGKTLTFTGQIGDVADANNSLKLLQATGGANIVLNHDNMSIKKVDIGTADSTLSLVAAGGKYLIGEFAHANGKGTVAINGSLTLKKGTSLSKDTARLKAIAFDNDHTLTIEDGVDLFTVNDVTGGLRNNAAGKGKLVFEGNSTVGAVVGLNNAFNQIKVNGVDSVVTFQENVNLTGNLVVAAKATAALNSQITANEINGGGTIRFANKVALADTTAVGVKIDKMATVEIAGADITFTKAAFGTNELAFTSANKVTATFDNLNVDGLKAVPITTTGNQIHNLVLTAGKNQTFDANIGSKENPFGEIKLTGNDALIFNGGLYGSVTTKTDKEGTVTITNQASVLYRLGSATAELAKVELNDSATIKEGIWSKDINVAAAKTLTFNGVVSSSGNMKIENGATALFSGPGVKLSADVNAANAGQGTVRFDDTAEVNKAIGATNALQLISFDGTSADKVASVSNDLFATNINVAAQKFRASDSITLNGSTTFTGSELELGTNNITLENGNSKFAGNVTVDLTLDANKQVGQIIVDAKNGAATFNPNAASAIKLQITDKASLPTDVEYYDLFVAANGGTVTPVDAAKATTQVQTDNRFVKWGFSEAKLSRENIATQTITAIFGKLSNTELLENAKRYGNAKNTGDAAEYTADLAHMNDEQMVDSVKRLTEQTAMHTPSIIAETTNTVSSGINNRIGALSNHPQPGMQTAVAAGENDQSIYGAWVNPFYSSTTQKERNGSAGYRQQMSGATLGFDTQANADMTVGIAASYAKSDVKYKNAKSGDKTKADTFMFSIYGIQQLTNEWFLQGHASFATTGVKNKDKRITLAGSETASGSFDTTSYGAELLAGYNHVMDNTVVTPLIGAAFTRVNDGGYKETGTTNQNLTISRKAMNKLETVAGLRAQMTTNMNGIDLTPEVHGFVRHDLIGKNSKLTASHSGLVDQLPPKAAKAQKTIFNVGLGVNAVSGMYEYGVGYDSFMANKSISHQGSLKVRVNF